MPSAIDNPIARALPEWQRLIGKANVFLERVSQDTGRDKPFFVDEIAAAVTAGIVVIDTIDGLVEAAGREHESTIVSPSSAAPPSSRTLGWASSRDGAKAAANLQPAGV